MVACQGSEFKDNKCNNTRFKFTDLIRKKFRIGVVKLRLVNPYLRVILVILFEQNQYENMLLA